MLRTQIIRVNPIDVRYRCFRRFDEEAFTSELRQRLEKVDYSKIRNDFGQLLAEFEKITNKHAPMITKKLRENNAPFASNKPRTKIRHRSSQIVR